MAQELIGLPDDVQLHQNIPNPFNRQTLISFLMRARRRLSIPASLSFRQFLTTRFGMTPHASHRLPNYLERAEQAGLAWPLPEEVDEEQLQALLFPAAEDGSRPSRLLPDMEYIHKELRRAHVTRKTLRWIGAATGEVQPAYLFVAVLGASSYTFAAFANQQLPAWIEGHIHMAQFYGGVTQLWIPDNVKTGVHKPCYYEPLINDSYQELADHYNTTILPTRTYAARDKAKVESAVLHAERRIMARLRDQIFFTLGALNDAIRRCLAELNARPFQKMSGSRIELFKDLDKPVLRSLPVHCYELGKWRQAKVNIDYHVQVDWHCYSVPYTLTQEQVEVHLAARTVEIFHKGRRVAAHARNRVRHGFTTDPAHRPKAHQKHLAWTPSRLIDWARTIGPQCSQAISNILQNKPHPEQGYRACLGMMRLGRDYGHERMEAACRRALALEACSYKSIRSILKTKLNQQPLPAEDKLLASPVSTHDNIRGEAYYKEIETDG